MTYAHGAHDKIVVWHSKQVARLAQRLAATPEGNGTMLDQSVVVFVSDNAEQHHSRGWRCPAVLLGSGGGKLKAEGRYIRYPARASTNNRTPTGGPATARAVGDLMSTLGYALGAPVDDWGKAGLETVKGPLAEIMT
jgi:hypothetical protein